MIEVGIMNDQKLTYRLGDRVRIKGGTVRWFPRKD
jgi:hypothetical protein